MDDATATDNRGTVSIEVTSETIAGACAGNYITFARSLRPTTAATAAARRRRSPTKTRRLLSSQAFLLTTLLSAVTSLILDDATASDNCEVSIEVSSETTLLALAQVSTRSRARSRLPTTVATAASATQTITVQDTTAPEFTSVPADYNLSAVMSL